VASGFRRHLTFANVMVVILTFIVLGGGAYAATQLPKNSVGAKQLKKGAVSKAKIQRSTLKALAGARGPAGATGSAGPAGPAGPAGGTPAAGVTLRGSFGTGYSDSTAPSNKSSWSATSFGGYILSQRPVINVVFPAAYGISSPPACPGTLTEPQASAGNLCVYVATAFPFKLGTLRILDSSQGTSTGVQYALDTGVATLLGDGRASRLGFVVNRTILVAGETGVFGTWAVTG
jgi:hypothetical protein